MWKPAIATPPCASTRDRRRGRQKAIVGPPRGLAVINAAHVDRWHGIPLEERGRACRRLTVPAERPETLEFRRRRIDVPRGTMDGASSLWLLCRLHSARSGRESDCAAPFP